MFRRKDELDMDGDINDVQGSLLSEESDNTVSVLSPQKAAEYQANKPSDTAQNTVKPVSAASAGVAAASTGASFSSPSTFGQTATKPAQPAQPVQRSSAPTPPAAMPSQATAPVNPVASNSNSNRPSSDSNRFRPAQEAPRPAPTAPTPMASTPAPSSTFNHSESNTMINKQQNPNERVLTVGNDILLKGEITTCDRLVIRGKVDATVSEVHTMELAAAGSFRGNAEVEYAEISGVFEGNLTVRTSLVIHQSGKVNGNISYGEVEIARGGTLTGEIKSIGTSAQQESIAKKKEKAAA